MFLRVSSGLFAITAVIAAVGCNSGETGTSGDTSTSTTTASGGSGGSGTAGSGGATAGSGGAGGGGEIVIGGDRPVKMHISSKYDPAKPAPLLILLHGYSASGMVQEDLYFKLAATADERGYIYGVPDGTFDKSSPPNRFWNATDACCNFFSSDVDDSAYLAGVVDEIEAHYNIDPKRVYFVGHSNGGFMSYRMACDHADKIAAIVSLAGTTFKDDTKCTPSEPVAVAHIHGDMDETIAYGGGQFAAGWVYPGAVETVQDWTGHDGCAFTATDGAPKDLDTSLTGAETSVSIYDSGCSPGGHVELWTIAGGSHIPKVSEEFRTSIFDFLDAHPKP